MKVHRAEKVLLMAYCVFVKRECRTWSAHIPSLRPSKKRAYFLRPGAKNIF
jgi:hypothetical protein